MGGGGSDQVGTEYIIWEFQSLNLIGW